MERRYEIIFRADEGIKVSFTREGDSLFIDMKNVGMYYANMPIPDGYERYNERHIRRISDGSVLTWIPVRMLKANGFRDGETGHKFGRRSFCGENFEEKRFIQPEVDIVKEQAKSIKKYAGFFVSTYHISEKGSVMGEKPIVGKTLEEMFQIANQFENKENFSSHILLGEEYDTIAEWGIESEENTMEQIAENSSEIGNYADLENSPKELMANGSNEAWKVAGTYDFTGNVATLTQEKYNGKHYVIRGGNFEENGAEYTAANRQVFYPKQIYPYVGVRLGFLMR